MNPTQAKYWVGKKVTFSYKNTIKYNESDFTFTQKQIKELIKPYEGHKAQIIQAYPKLNIKGIWAIFIFSLPNGERFKVPCNYEDIPEVNDEVLNYFLHKKKLFK